MDRILHKREKMNIKSLTLRIVQFYHLVIIPKFTFQSPPRSDPVYLLVVKVCEEVISGVVGLVDLKTDCLGLN